MVIESYSILTLNHMTKKHLYTIETTLKSNILLNYYRCYSNALDNEQRTNHIYNKVRNVEEINNTLTQTDNLDKYYNTKFIDYINSMNYLIEDELEDDDF